MSPYVKSQGVLSTSCGPPLEVDEIAVERFCRGDDTIRLNRTEIHAAFLCLNAHGLSARVIAERLGITNRTVQRWRKEGPPGVENQPIEQRFWRFAEKTEDGCWLWRGGCTQEGYGQIKIRGRQFRAHRVSYEMFVGPIPDALQIDHLCRVRNCVNPSHLEPVTPLENTRRTGHGAEPTCRQGHEFSPKNTYLDPRGKRCCRTCRREASRRSIQRRGAA